MRDCGRNPTRLFWPRPQANQRKTADGYHRQAPTASGDVSEKNMVVSRDTQVTFWQWPAHRVFWGIRLQKGQAVLVVAKGEDGAMICSLRGDQYFVLWPDDKVKEQTDVLV